DLADQVKSNCYLLEEVRGIANSEEELRTIDELLDDNKRVMAKAKEALEMLKSEDCSPGEKNVPC
ncbi:MAG: hypothetical protein FWC50_14650, partial [Planctomycetaceae bacterium]|nr:hypothetical protein [Planctomycetaceae bacterium]